MNKTMHIEKSWPDEPEAGRGDWVNMIISILCVPFILVCFGIIMITMVFWKPQK